MTLLSLRPLVSLVARRAARVLPGAVAIAWLVAGPATIVTAAQPAPGQAPPAAATPAEAGSHAGQGEPASQAAPAESHTAPAAGGHATPASGASHGEEAHGESAFSFASRIANFLILAFGLWYLLRSPFGRYLDARAQQIKSGLTNAAALRAEASARLADIEHRIKGLPGEIESLKKRGAEEIAAEGARIRQAADAERVRLVENARREIDLQLQAARRELTHYAGDLAVDLAERHIKAQITGSDQQRLIDRYVTQMRAINE